MDVFISWSGERSRAVAEALRNWLPKIINAIKPWLSSEDIDKGARWGTDVASRLENAKAGIICLTPSNLHSDWILFEAGALSKTLQNTYVCPLLIGLEPSDIKPPLAQFQATRSVKDDILKLLKTLNAALDEGALTDAHIDEAFGVWWPKLEAQLNALPVEESKANPHRADRDLLEEILSLVRDQNRTSSHRLQPAPESLQPSLAARRDELIRLVTTLDKTITTHTQIFAGTKPGIAFFASSQEKPKYVIAIPPPVPENDFLDLVYFQIHTQLERQIQELGTVPPANPADK
jgi:hypothetical protein